MAGPLHLKDAVNPAGFWSGDPIGCRGLTCYRGAVVSFCNTGCRDTIEAATRAFDAALEER